MQPSEIAMINAQLQRFYGERYAGITTDMAGLWYEQLKPFPYELAIQAIRRWAADHLPHQPPTLTQLITQMEDVQAEQRRQRAAEGLHTTTAEYSERDDDYSSAEVRALIRSVWPDMYPEPKAPMKEEERAARQERLREQLAQLLNEQEEAR